MPEERGAEQDPLLGRLFENRYEVISKLGEGGMGTVYRARHRHMDRMVALKVIRPDVTNPRTVKRFFREMKITSRIQHPNTVSVYDFGQTEDGEVYLAMELLEGRPLSLVVGDELSVERVLKISVGMARALSAAHSEGIIHRDLKPENIMLINLYGEEDHVKVLDFGIARFAAGTPEGDKSAITAQGVVVGTPLYMSPEQITDAQLDHRADLYALGVLMYELLVGDPPYVHEIPVKILHMHLNDPIPFASDFRDDVPEWLDTLITQLLAKDPKVRPQSAEEVLQEIERHRAPTVAPLQRLRTDTARRRRRATPTSIVAVMVALAVGMALAGWTFGVLSQRRPPVVPVVEAGPDGREAQKLYIDARAAWRTGTFEGHEQAVERCRAALEKDPRLFAAHALLADLYLDLSSRGMADPAEVHPEAFEAARTAVALNPGSAQAHAALAGATLYRDWNWKAAQREYQLCLTLDPSYATCHRRYAVSWLTPRGDIERAREEIGLARAVEESAGLAQDAAEVEYYAGDYDAAIHYARFALDQDPDLLVSRYTLGRALVQQRRIGEAIVELEKALSPRETAMALSALSHAHALADDLQRARAVKSRLMDEARKSYVDPYYLAVVEAGLARSEPMFELLERAAEARTPTVSYLAVDPVFAEWRKDPRFREIVARVRLQ